MRLDWQEGMWVVDAYTNDRQGRKVGVIKSVQRDQYGAVTMFDVAFGLLDIVGYNDHAAATSLKPFWLQKIEWFTLDDSNSANKLRRVEAVLWELATDENGQDKWYQFVKYDHNDPRDRLWEGLALLARLDADDCYRSTGNRVGF